MSVENCEICGYLLNEKTGECAHCRAVLNYGSVRSFWHKVCVGLWLLFNSLMVVWIIQYERLTPEELRNAGDPAAGFAVMFDAMTHDAMGMLWVIGNMVLALLMSLTVPE